MRVSAFLQYYFKGATIEMPIPIIIDTDPGIDDAAAISFALHHPEIDVKLINTVHGNVSIDKTTRNALTLVEYFNKDVPVSRGQAVPLIQPPIYAEHVHGETGMDGFEFPPLTRTVKSDNGVEAMRSIIVESHFPITLVPIGPLTNIALLLKHHPDIKHQIKEIVLMGGSASRGNVTVAAEFNIYADPEAAQIVFDSGVPITVIGLDVVRTTNLPLEKLPQIQNTNQTGAMLVELFRHYRGENFQQGLNVYDAYTIMYLINPDLFTLRPAHVDVELKGEHTRGMTIMDFQHSQPNAQIVMQIQYEDFLDCFFSLLSYCP